MIHDRACALLLVLAVASGACGSRPAPTKGAIAGRIRAADGTTAIGGATVRLSDGRSVIANETGWFFFSDVAPADRIVATALHDGYAEAIEPTTVRAGAVAQLEILMVPVTATATIDAAVGGRITDNAGATANFPAGMFVGADGRPATGAVTVTLAPLDPSDRTRMAAFPGDFSARRADGSNSLLETVVPMAVTARQGDAMLNIAPGMMAEITMPIPAASAATAPATIELWSLDPATGAWREEGTATRVADSTAPGGAVYRAMIPHLSWWNADRPITETTCLRGCVRAPDNHAVANVHVNAAGVDYQGESDTTTGADGCFALNVKLGARVATVATTTGLVSDPITVTASSTPMRAATDPTRCQDIGTLSLAAPLAQIILQWGAMPSDLDSHTTGPDSTQADGRFHVYYGQRGGLAAGPYCNLDTDDTSSYGPEITTIVRAPGGRYRFSVHNYSGQTSGAIEQSQANVTVLLSRQGLIQRFDVPTSNGSNGNVWRVFDLVSDGQGNFDLNVINSFADSAAGYGP